MTQDPLIDDRAASARHVIEQLWYRARINAFAHRAAYYEASKAAVGYFRREIIGVLGSILSIILVYVLSTFGESIGLKVASVAFILFSVALTLFSLFQSVMASHLKLEVQAADHEHLLKKYQYICQRAREVNWPGLPPDEVLNLLRDLERDFQLLKGTGTEPADRHFDEAHRIVRKIQEDKSSRIAQSFPIGATGVAEAVDRRAEP